MTDRNPIPPPGELVTAAAELKRKEDEIVAMLAQRWPAGTLVEFKTNSRMVKPLAGKVIGWIGGRHLLVSIGDVDAMRSIKKQHQVPAAQIVGSRMGTTSTGNLVVVP